MGEKIKYYKKSGSIFAPEIVEIEGTAAEIKALLLQEAFLREVARAAEDPEEEDEGVKEEVEEGGGP